MSAARATERHLRQIANQAARVTASSWPFCYLAETYVRKQCSPAKAGTQNSQAPAFAGVHSKGNLTTASSMQSPAIVHPTPPTRFRSRAKADRQQPCAKAYASSTRHRSSCWDSLASHLRKSTGEHLAPRPRRSKAAQTCDFCIGREGPPTHAAAQHQAYPAQTFG